MTEATDTAPILIFTYGNPSRGDDALGPALYDLLESRRHAKGPDSHVDLLTDYQLQIEHAIDLQGRKQVLFVDASLTAHPPFEFYPLQPSRDGNYTTHAMSPGAVLSVYEQINEHAAPPAYMLSIRGYEFGLGHPLSDLARSHLEDSLRFLDTLLDKQRWDHWTDYTTESSASRS